MSLWPTCQSLAVVAEFRVRHADLEALILRLEAAPAEMPLARVEGLVAARLQRFGEGDFFEREFLLRRLGGELAAGGGKPGM